MFRTKKINGKTIRYPVRITQTQKIFREMSLARLRQMDNVELTNRGHDLAKALEDHIRETTKQADKISTSMMKYHVKPRGVFLEQELTKVLKILAE